MTTEQHVEQPKKAQAPSIGAEAADKRPYHPPQSLVRWGSMADLTRGGGGNQTDVNESGSSFVAP